MACATASEPALRTDVAIIPSSDTDRNTNVSFCLFLVLNDKLFVLHRLEVQVFLRLEFVIHKKINLHIYEIRLSLDVIVIQNLLIDLT